MDWIDVLRDTIAYIEAHLEDELTPELLAARAHYSPFHFHRVFTILCGCTIGEYVRKRRLSVAGTALAEGKAKVIDVAYRYGYDSPDSFCKAFCRFHGVTPSQARSGGAALKSFSPLHIDIRFTGGNIMDYKITEKPAMLLTGFKRRFTGDPNDKQYQDHHFACETRVEQYVLEGRSKQFADTYWVMTNFTDDGYDFYFAYELPHWAREDFDEDLGEFAKRYTHLEIPAGLYVVCETERCMYPTDLVEALRRRMVTEWLPSSGYELREAPELGLIHWPFEDGNDAVNNSHYCEIWLPIRKKGS